MSEVMRHFVCEVCGHEWDRPQKSPGQPPKVCGPECHKLRAITRTKKWQKDNPVRTAEWRASYSKPYWAKYYEKNRERLIAQSVEYLRRNPEKRQAYNSARYALTRGAPDAEHFSLDEIYERDHHRCHLCGKNVDRDQATMDHLVPVALGGSHTRANVSLAHRSCNSSKKTSARGEQLRLI